MYGCVRVQAGSCARVCVCVFRVRVRAFARLHVCACVRACFRVCACVSVPEPGLCVRFRVWLFTTFWCTRLVDVQLDPAILFRIISHAAYLTQLYNLLSTTLSQKPLSSYYAERHHVFNCQWTKFRSHLYLSVKLQNIEFWPVINHVIVTTSRCLIKRPSGIQNNASK